MTKTRFSLSILTIFSFLPKDFVDYNLISSPWNMNNYPTSKHNILRDYAHISGLGAPWLYFGALFTWFSWHTEDLHLFSVNYLHMGAPKIWYSIPLDDADKFEEFVRKSAPNASSLDPNLLHNLKFFISPDILKDNGIKVSSNV